MINITLHAIERYQERIDSAVTFQQAKSLILHAMSRARRIKEKTHQGDAYYVTDELRLIVAEEKGNLTVLSVLQLYEPEEKLIPAYAIELAKEYDAARLTVSEKEKKRKGNRLKELDDLRAALSKAKDKIKELHKPSLTNLA